MGRVDFARSRRKLELANQSSDHCHGSDFAIDPAHAETNAVKRRIFYGDHWIFSAVGLHYCVNAALISPALHYPAVIVDSHANDPDVDSDHYELTIVMNNGKETTLVVTEKTYKMAMNGEPLEICHRESPFGVILLDIHVPQAGNKES